MSFQFLCAAHRQQLSSNASAAELRWEEWMETGRRAFADRDWRHAVRFLGCSFELSELLLACDSQPNLDALDRFMVSGHFLAECFANTGNRDLQQHCLLAVHHRLLKVLRTPEGRSLPLKRNIEFSLQMLSRYYEAEGNRDAFDHCQRESQRLLNRCYH
ncbi:hypothetical protein IMCC21906_01362 [Spongiibacter sp. IMCC21906]|jgi:hypothetical protein|uniref:hypothetical protein n=1 Tax=Spongiibacter sp. IMCC21906 TaxID=1620392 RepID=UPI00062DFC10|nr:hypothetical protein [Spongiibacter sp. IMCC21906]AKH69040.1 hypothetical protein IMCC21906_01362 [Spongiibacter sp. IMCC21906]